MTSDRRPLRWFAARFGSTLQLPGPIPNEHMSLAATLTYRDRKRPLWLLSLLVPCLVGAGPLLSELLQDARWSNSH